jgi:hypothetical protein
VTRAVTVAALGQDQAHTVLIGDPLDPTDDLDCPLALELVEDQLDHPRHPGAGAGGAPEVSVIMEEPFDSHPRGGGYVSPAVENFRNGCERDASLFCDGRKRDPLTLPCGSALRWWDLFAVVHGHSALEQMFAVPA